ncbi:MAG: dephospho-CoA kinase [Litorimonas sp.]
MKIIGLTGSIGMGKTTTANMFKALGCPVFNADAAVHKLYSRGGKAVPLIRSVFPDAIIDDSVNRKVLGGHIRADPLNLTVLESFIHPWVGQMRASFLKKAEKDNARAVIFDVPLLFETNGDKDVDVSVVVTAPADVQKARVLARPGMTLEIFNMLLFRQMPDKDKRARADYIISTGQGLENARKQVQLIFDKVLNTK